MRIVQAAGWYFPDSLGGTEVYVGALAERLRAKGHEVLVTAPDASHATERHYHHEGVPVYRYPIPEHVTRDEARGYVRVRGAERLHQWLKETRPDVVHFHTFVTGLGLAELQAARLAGARVIVTTHAASLGFLCERGTLMRYGRTLCDAIVEPSKCGACALQQRGLPIPIAQVLSRVPSTAAMRGLTLPGRLGTAFGMRALMERNRESQAKLFELADAVVVLSRWAAEALVANGAPSSKIVVNRLGVVRRSETWAHKPGPADRPARPPIVAGFVGRAQSIKGLEDAVRAVVSLPRAVGVKLRAVVVARTAGDRTIVDRCHALAADDRRVVFEPAVHPRDVPALLAELDVLLCPSKAIEGGPTVALEAISVGTPVIGSAIPALTEIVRDGVDGWLHPPGDWRALAALLSKLAAEPGRIDACRARLGPSRTMNEVCADYERLYQS